MASSIIVATMRLGNSVVDRRAIWTQDRVELSHIEIYVRMILRRRRADTIKLFHANTNFRRTIVVPIFWILGLVKGRLVRLNQRFDSCLRADAGIVQFVASILLVLVGSLQTSRSETALAGFHSGDLSSTPPRRPPNVVEPFLPHQRDHFGESNRPCSAPQLHHLHSPTVKERRSGRCLV